LLGWIGNATVTAAALAGWLAVVVMAGANAYLRQKSIRRLLAPPDITWRDFWWDVGGVSLSAMLHLALMVSSATSRRIVWRHTEYELGSPETTRIVRRMNRGANSAPAVSHSPLPEVTLMPPR
jgi:hypothetical protein